MRYFLIVAILSMSGDASAQTIFESMGTVSSSYSSIWTKQSSRISIDLIREYPLMTAQEQSANSAPVDTSFYILLKVNSNTVEQEGFSLGVSLLGSALGGGTAVHGSNTYTYQRESGVIVMGYEAFMGFYAALNKTYAYISLVGSKKGDNNIVATYGYKDVLFGGEVNVGSIQTINYFIQIGDAAFTMTPDKFKEIAISLRDMKSEWERHL